MFISSILPGSLSDSIPENVSVSFAYYVGDHMFGNVCSDLIIAREHMFVNTKIEHIFGIYVCFLHLYMIKCDRTNEIESDINRFVIIGNQRIM